MMTTLLQLSKKNGKIPRNTCVGQQLVRTLFPCHVMSFLSPFISEKKKFWEEGSLPYTSYPGGTIFSYISLKDEANRLHEKQKVGSTRRVTCLAGSPFCDGRITFLAGLTFLHINIWLTQPGQLGQGESIRACANAVGLGKRVNISSLM